MQETFGPVVVINTVADIEEAARRANGTASGLGSSVFSARRGPAIAGVLAGLWWHPICAAAAAGMAALLIGALAAHRRAGDSGKDTAPALVTVAYLVIALAG